MDKHELESKLAQDFEEFLRHRAKLVVVAINALAAGASPSVDALWSTNMLMEDVITH